MRLKEGMAKDSTDKMAIVTYESLIEKSKWWKSLQLCKCKSANIPWWASFKNNFNVGLSPSKKIF